MFCASRWCMRSSSSMCEICMVRRQNAQASVSRVARARKVRDQVAHSAFRALRRQPGVEAGLDESIRARLIGGRPGGKVVCILVLRMAVVAANPLPFDVV